MQNAHTLTHIELADWYGINVKTLHKWLAQEGIAHDGKRLMPATLQEAFEKIGHPDWSKTIKPPLKIVKPCYTRIELAQLYDYSRDAFFRRCRAEGLSLPKGRLPPKVAMYLFQCWGIPTSILMLVEIVIT
jgi:hypothetical protein